ncbi:MAG: radical SAM/SPASM domain-containing protein [Candidatus Pacearchaeota archaeon]
MSEEQILTEEKKRKSKKISKKANIYSYLAKKIIYFPLLRNSLIKMLENKMYQEAVVNCKDHPKKVQERKIQYLSALLSSGIRNFDRGYISKEFINRAFDTLIKFGFTEKELLREIVDKFKEKYGQLPPTFIVLSPTQKCNLSCIGCYASSNFNSAAFLPYEIVDKIVDEVYNEWANRFFVISGGEPLMYNDNGKTLFDVWEKYKDMFFLFFTNGTLIDIDTAKKLARVGNATPAISIEGYEKETDERRGKGTFKKILEATENLKKVGVPFGVSVTVTKKNFDLLKEESFYDFCFKELGASYMWMFQLMPIGKATCVKELMITPEQRVVLFRVWEKMLSEKKYPVGDFWNSGPLSDGCIAYGRNGGYLYIDWNGNIPPCAFVPFYEDNIIELYSKGKKLSDALFSKLFINGRKWQQEYGLSHTNNPGNWLMPCSIRDNWKTFKKYVLTENSKPEDSAAKEFIESKEIDKLLEEFDDNLEKLTRPIWENEYLDKDSNKSYNKI